MNKLDIAELGAFMAVARHRNFRRAAIERGVTPSAVSHAVRGLEARVGVRLFQRSTRSVSLTEAGTMLFARLAPAFGEIDEALDSLNDFRSTPFGTVRINVPSAVAPYVLGPVMGDLLRRNPGLKLEVVATDRLVDIVADGFDAGLRFGERLSPDMVAVRVKPALRFAVVGAPAYFADRPPPRTPHDLKNHVCIRYNYPSGKAYNWEFQRGREEIVVEVDGPLTLDDQALMVEAAIDGMGLAYVLENRAAPHLADRRLQRCLENWCGFDSLYLYYPSRRHVSAGLRALIEAVKA